MTKQRGPNDRIDDFTGTVKFADIVGAQVIADLETLTGKKFSIETVSSSSGDIVVARTSSARIYPPDCEFLKYLGSKPPVAASLEKLHLPSAAKDSYEFAREESGTALYIMRDQIPGFSEVVRKGEDKKSKVRFAPDDIADGKGIYRAHIDFVLQPGQSHTPIDVAKLHELAAAARANPDYKPPADYAGFDKPYTREQIDFIPALRERALENVSRFIEKGDGDLVRTADFPRGGVLVYGANNKDADSKDGTQENSSNQPASKGFNLIAMVKCMVAKAVEKFTGPER